MDINAMEVAQKYCEGEAQSSAIICYTNQQAADYNAAVRKILYPGSSHVTVGDKLMVINNSYYGECELLNGDIITVVEVSDSIVSQSAPVWTEIDGVKQNVTLTLEFREIGFQADGGNVYRRYIIDTLLNNNSRSLTSDQFKALYINFVMRVRSEKGVKEIGSEEFTKEMANDAFYNALHVKYGYAFTCHKSQGGEWDTIFVDFSKRAGLDNDGLRWKYTAITRASRLLWCINLPNISPMSALKITAITKTTKVSPNAFSLGDVSDTPYHTSQVPPLVKCKYWSVVENMSGTSYSVRNIICKPWRDIYEVDTPKGIVRIDAVYNGAGLFTKYDTKTNDDELIECFQNEDNIKYEIEYHPSYESLKTLHGRMISLCDECGIVLTNVVEEHYKLIYYMKSSGNYASLTFYFDGNGFISYACPLSDIGEADLKLDQLIDKLT